jgi:hypothetical protein
MDPSKIGNGKNSEWSNTNYTIVKLKYSLPHLLSYAIILLTNLALNGKC